MAAISTTERRECSQPGLNSGVFVNRVLETSSSDPRAWQLLQAARNLVSAVFSGDAKHPYLLRHIDESDFRGTHDRSQKVMDIHEYLSLIRDISTIHYPKTRLEVTDETVDFDDSAELSEAIVWQFMKVIRPGEEVVRNGLRMSKWRQNPKGIWMCYYCAVYRCDPLVSAENDQLF